MQRREKQLASSSLWLQGFGPMVASLGWMHDWTRLGMLPAAGEGRISHIELRHVHTHTAIGPLPLLSTLVSRRVIVK